MSVGRRLCAVAVAALLGAGLAPGGGPPAFAAPIARTPAPSSALSSLTLGRHDTCVLTSGQVRCWGRNDRGQLGRGDTTSRGASIADMGANLPAIDLGTGRTAVAVSAGMIHSCAILDDGSLKCWGYNFDGQLGLGNNVDRGNDPGEMGDHLPAVALGTGRTAVAVSAGQFHTCAILDNATMKCWGDGPLLGLSPVFDRGDSPGEMGDNLPVVNPGTGRTVVEVATGSLHSCVRLDNGTVKCWGTNAHGQLGQGDTSTRTTMGDGIVAVDLGTGRTATAIAVGYGDSCALLDNGQVKCWGLNDVGQLGRGDTANRGDGAGEMGDNLPAIDLGTGRTAVAISAAARHVCALLDNATVKCWGYNNRGQLGLGDTATRGDGPGEMGDNLPAAALGTGRTATAVAAGGYFDTADGSHTCATLDDGTLKCWGYNTYGQLGQGTTTARGDGPNEMGDNLATTAPTGTGVTGGVTGTEGATLPGALLATLDPTTFAIKGGGVAGVDGRFGIASTAGNQLVYAIDPTATHQAGFFGAPTTVSVTTGAASVADPSLPPSTGSIAGTISEQGSGTPIADAYALALDASSGAIVRGDQTDGTGAYALTNLTPGSYYVVFLDLGGDHTPQFFPVEPTLATALPVPVSAGGSAPANGVLPSQTAPGSSLGITGVIREPSGATLAGVVVVALRAGDFTVARAGLTNGTGGYSLAVDPGQYLLEFVDPTGAHRVEWYDDQPPDGLGAATPVSAPAVVNPVLARTRGSVSGTVTTSGGAPVSGAFVIAVRPSGIAGAAVTAANGTYTIANLPPDNYRAAVLRASSGQLEYWPDAPDFFGADLFVVAAGQDSPVDATL